MAKEPSCPVGPVIVVTESRWCLGPVLWSSYPSVPVVVDVCGANCTWFLGKGTPLSSFFCTPFRKYPAFPASRCRYPKPRGVKNSASPLSGEYSAAMSNASPLIGDEGLEKSRDFLPVSASAREGQESFALILRAGSLFLSGVCGSYVVDENGEST